MEKTKEIANSITFEGRPQGRFIAQITKEDFNILDRIFRGSDIQNPDGGTKLQQLVHNSGPEESRPCINISTSNALVALPPITRQMMIRDSSTSITCSEKDDCQLNRFA